MTNFKSIIFIQSYFVSPTIASTPRLAYKRKFYAVNYFVDYHNIIVLLFDVRTREAGPGYSLILQTLYKFVCCIPGIFFCVFMQKSAYKLLIICQTITFNFASQKYTFTTRTAAGCYIVISTCNTYAIKGVNNFPRLNILTISITVTSLSNTETCKITHTSIYACVFSDSKITRIFYKVI